MPLRNITTEYVNVRTPPSSPPSSPPVSSNDKKLLRLVFFSFGILCIIQATLNVTLRIFQYDSVICKNFMDQIQEEFDYYFPLGWVYFNTSLYFISTSKKNWEASRQYCLNEGADLIVINSKEEQEFTRRFHRFMWIGLSKTNNTTWTWVDGTPLTSSYWGPNQPSMEKDAYCIELKFFELPNTWRDIRCDKENEWICEKPLPF